MTADNSQIWFDYCHQVLDLSSEEIRPGCEPRIFSHGDRVSNVVVLIHGLSDSPFYMRAIGERFYKMGFNVLLPLLPAHGINNVAKAQQRMENVTLDEWKKAVNFTVEYAKQLGNKVSIGGLSTGGTLAVYQGINYPQDINGGIFLFSAAIDLGDFPEIILSSNNRLEELLKRLADKSQAKIRGRIVGDNPYTYAWIPTHSVEQLVYLIEEIEGYYPNRKQRYDDLKQPVFIAHSEFDETVPIEDLQLLINNHPLKQKTDFSKS